MVTSFDKYEPPTCYTCGKKLLRGNFVRATLEFSDRPNIRRTLCEDCNQHQNGN